MPYAQNTGFLKLAIYATFDKLPVNKHGAGMFSAPVQGCRITATCVDKHGSA